LAPVITDEPVAVVAAVELDHELSRRVVQIGACEKFAVRAIQVRLHLRLRQPRVDEQAAQACLHRRFSRLGRCVKAAQSKTKCLIGEDEKFHPRKSLAEVAHRSLERSGRQTVDHGNIALRQGAVPDPKRMSRSDRGARWHCNFDWVARIHVKVVQPGCRQSCEDGAWETLVPPTKRLQGILAKAGEHVQLRAEAPPALATQRAERKSGVPCLIEGEGPQRQLGWNSWSATHDIRIAHANLAANPAC
jgi:hypothetical protein